MDPEVCWKQLREAIVEQDWEGAADAAESLLRWLRRGGHTPRAVDLFEAGGDEPAWNNLVVEGTCALAMERYGHFLLYDQAEENAKDLHHGG